MFHVPRMFIYDVLHDISDAKATVGDDNKEASKFVGLAMIQTYDGRRKVPRSDISISAFETCLRKVVDAAKTHSGADSLQFDQHAMSYVCPSTSVTQLQHSGVSFYFN